jgi:nicotinamidase-related amidase
MEALVVIDVQNEFSPEGAMAVEDKSASKCASFAPTHIARETFTARSRKSAGSP